jgi:hypothetical protein
MTPSQVGIFVPLLVIGILVLVSFVVTSVAGKMKKKLLAEAELRFDLDSLLKGPDMANFFGIKSKGMGQVRGLGLLLLSKDKLWFKQGVVDNEIEIPIGDIQIISTPKWFLGKSKGRKLLCVHFNTPNGEDEVAFLVRDLDSWCSTLEQAQRCS